MNIIETMTATTPESLRDMFYRLVEVDHSKIFLNEVRLSEEGNLLIPVIAPDLEPVYSWANDSEDHLIDVYRTRRAVIVVHDPESWEAEHGEDSLQEMTYTDGVFTIFGKSRSGVTFDTDNIDWSDLLKQALSESPPPCITVKVRLLRIDLEISDETVDIVAVREAPDHVQYLPYGKESILLDLEFADLSPTDKELIAEEIRKIAGT